MSSCAYSEIHATFAFQSDVIDIHMSTYIIPRRFLSSLSNHPVKHHTPRYLIATTAQLIMENPVKEIADVIHLLTQSPPSNQRKTIEKYFSADASFTHPFCRTGKWPNSRMLVQIIYRWYKIMSPSIDITVHSIGMCDPDFSRVLQKPTKTSI